MRYGFFLVMNFLRFSKQISIFRRNCDLVSTVLSDSQKYCIPIKYKETFLFTSQFSYSSGTKLPLCSKSASNAWPPLTDGF